ncbi:hypothetical protein [Streptomyces sp. NBC_01212]|uniref:hypothetical protein n=1 Tax=Streptomyces sp. NBC_01212 TaxID=2903775 RepID=UPI002E0DFB4A|nr:hypothetical protein OG722_04905 [Streptomyces sp. NBC_01212]
MSATANVLTIRADYARRGEDVTTLSDVELLLKELSSANALITKLSQRDEDRRASEVERERATRTAARRYYENQMAAWDGLIFHSLTQMSGETVRAALYRAANLSSLAGTDTTSEAREAAERALRLWERDIRDLRDGAGLHQSVSVADYQRREIARLRKLITDHAVSITDHVRERGSQRICTCVGCELARSMDDVEEPAERDAA